MLHVIRLGITKASFMTWGYGDVIGWPSSLRDLQNGFY